MKKRVLVGLSGGVDSAVSAYLLQKEGYEVVAGFMKNYVSEEEDCPTREDRDEAIKVAEFLGIKEFIIFDFREEYNKKVVEYIYKGYQSGITPNPDILCNSEIKFKLFLENAMKLGFDYIATGHYARIITNDKLQITNGDNSVISNESEKSIKNKPSFSDIPERPVGSTLGVKSEIQESGNIITSSSEVIENTSIRHSEFISESIKIDTEINSEGRNNPKISSPESTYHLLKGLDPNKDQSYFLAGLNQFQLSKALFPIGHLEKPEVRAIAEEIGLPNAKRKDSQGICFVGKVDMHKFLEKKIPTKKGNIVDTYGQVLGEHNGAWFFTIGQRKGIQIGGGPALFVVKKDIEKNEIVVGTEKDLELYSDSLQLRNWHWIGEEYSFPIEGKAKIRYRQEDQDVRLSQVGNGIIEAKFEQKQRAITSGQTLALYIGDELIGSGIIE